MVQYTAFSNSIGDHTHVAHTLMHNVRISQVYSRAAASDPVPFEVMVAAGLNAAL